MRLLKLRATGLPLLGNARGRPIKKYPAATDRSDPGPESPPTVELSVCHGANEPGMGRQWHRTRDCQWLGLPMHETPSDHSLTGLNQYLRT